jgi:hypothetical protein
MLKEPRGCGGSLGSRNLVGTYGDEDALLNGIRGLKKAGVAIKNVFTPYPVNEVFHELGLETRFPYLATLYGVCGLLGTFAFLYWTSVVNFPITVGGKPHLSLSFVVILFVMVINIGIVLSVTSFFLRQRLFPGKQAECAHPGNMDDRFSIVIELGRNASAREVGRLHRLLTELGAKHLAEKENLEGV